MENILRKIASSKRSVKILKLISLISAIVVAFSFIALLYTAYKNAKIEVLYVLVITGVPFVCVSIFRHIFNAPRPYELYDFYPEKPREKEGKSFPSRHVFSGFVIGVVAFNYSLVFGILIIATSLILAASRILLGIHFVRDCVCGALIGIASALIGMWIFGLI